MKDHMTTIQIVNVEITQRQGTAGKKGYEQAEVVYKQEYNGKTDVKNKKIMSFVNPAVFATLKDAKTGEVYEVTQVKEGDFWQWTAITKADASKPAQQASSAPKPSSNGGFNRDFETKEERAQRQALIVRQSSLGHAVSLLTVGAKTPPDVKLVKALADDLVAYVYNVPDLFEQPNDLPASDDIPY